MLSPPSPERCAKRAQHPLREWHQGTGEVRGKVQLHFLGLWASSWGAIGACVSTWTSVAIRALFFIYKKDLRCLNAQTNYFDDAEQPPQAALCLVAQTQQQAGFGNSLHFPKEKCWGFCFLRHGRTLPGKLQTWSWALSAAAHCEPLDPVGRRCGWGAWHESVTTSPCPPLLVPTADTFQLCPVVHQTWGCLCLTCGDWAVMGIKCPMGWGCWGIMDVMVELHVIPGVGLLLPPSIHLEALLGNICEPRPSEGSSPGSSQSWER